MGDVIIMAKWFNETLLIKYWEDRCTNYELQDGTKINSAKRNPSFGRYPDISENFLSDGRMVPVEIEWLTTNFDKHGHDISELRDNEGLLVVYKQNAGFPVEQIEIDKDDLIEWFKEKAEELCIETLQEIENATRKSKEPQIYLFYVPASGDKNFNIALQHGVWGFPANNKGVARGLSKLMQIKKGDILIFVKEWKADPSIKVSGGRVSAEKYIGTFKEIVAVTVTKAFYEDTKEIWSDTIYPYRVGFRKEPIFIGKNIPCNQKKLGKSLHEILRKLQVNGSVERIDSSLIVKLMSLCTE